MRPVDARQAQARIRAAFRNRAFVTASRPGVLDRTQLLSLVQAAVDGRGRRVAAEHGVVSVHGPASEIVFRPLSKNDPQASELLSWPGAEDLRESVEYVVEINDQGRELIDDLFFIGGRLRGSGLAELVDGFEIEQPVDLSDLAPYETPFRPADPSILAIGWVDSDGFPTGPVPTALVEKLDQVIEGRKGVFDARAMVLRALAECPVCGERLSRLASEVWIPAVEGGYFVAPSHINHLIRQHDYHPPDVFLRAIEAFDLSRPFVAEESAAG